MLLFLDFETYYDREYSLKKMTPAEYILDPRFEAICMGACWGDHKPFILEADEIAPYLADLTPSKITTVTYNALFDNAVLAWRYNFVPGRMVDGLGMARALVGSRLRSLSLGNVAEHLGVGQKGDEIHQVIGMHRADIQRDQDLWDRFRAYCLKDTALLREIFVTLHKEFPKDEYAVMDAVLRCCIEPTFRCDVALLQSHLENIRRDKARLCEAVGADKDAISGNGSFLELLKAQGIEIQYKDGKRGPIPATAKTDKWMNDLLEDENPAVQALAAARLGVKSTLEERRSERLIKISSLPWPSKTSLMPIPLRYCGAHTWRLSGDWKINMQNLPSARMGDPVLRQSLLAPPGHTIVVGDLKQIEARLVAWFCGSDTLLTEFRKDADPYSRLAEQIFETPVDKATLDGVARHIGKAGVLGCGYGMGAEKFYEAVLRQGRSMLKPHQMEQLKALWTPDLAQKSVDTYRRRYSEVRQMWSRLDEFKFRSWYQGQGEFEFGPSNILEIGQDPDGNGYIRGPGGRELRYSHPYVENEGYIWSTRRGVEWVEYGSRPVMYAGLGSRVYTNANGDTRCFNSGVPRKIYGAALLENIIQFLARIVMFDIAMRLKDDCGLRFIHQVHDELVFCVPDRDVDVVVKALKVSMRTPPAWCSDLPLDCDVGSGQRYGDCK